MSESELYTGDHLKNNDHSRNIRGAGIVFQSLIVWGKKLPFSILVLALQIWNAREWAITYNTYM